ncbi:ATP-dependent nuclease subunit B [Streptococcus caprae]|uniref:ATP-dependent nuclease subunit B n=1 Tax=Streptococcus caprae TaxID=1640501 RepID=A0ABV8CY54_9STRE
MKLLYTDMSQDLTAILAREAQSYVDQGKRVFYIAPNSLSFEKEKRVLSFLPEQASFGITITRFAQMARYFTLNHEGQEGKALDTLGLSMSFFKVLSQCDDGDLKVYGRLKKDPSFITNLVQLYEELKRSQLSIYDLEGVDSPKMADLVLIFTRLEASLLEQDYELQSKTQFFLQQVLSGALDSQLTDLVLVIDGFTRFSAEEEQVVQALQSRCSEIVIGVYGTEKAYRSTYTDGNIYQASVDFLRSLAQTYEVRPVYIPSDGLERTPSELDTQAKLALLSQKIESRHDFTDDGTKLVNPDTYPVQLWEAGNQREELEQVAKSIRGKLHDGYRYKDMLVLLGDVESYQLQLGQVFDQYEIPYYLGQAEPMAAHPLVHFVESLERLKRYNFRAEDLLNLLKSGLYGTFSRREIDKFEQYVTYADLKGQTQFARPIPENSKTRYDEEAIEVTRQAVMAPLEDFFKAQAQSATSLLEKFTQFLTAIDLPKNMADFAREASPVEVEHHQEVWKTFSQLLETMAELFGQDKLKLEDFLALLSAGMTTATYRLVPATVDVVNVRSYELIAPHANRFVYAIGLSQSNFPKVTKNTSLISDDERILLNEREEVVGKFDLPSQDNLRRNHYAAISLLNSATEELVLSRPQLFNEAEDAVSPYLHELEAIGFEVEDRWSLTHKQRPDDLGTYSALLSRLVELFQTSPEGEGLSKEDQTFWSVATRVLKKKLDQDGLHLPLIDNSLQTKPVAPEVMAAIFPTQSLAGAGQSYDLSLSASSLTQFYNNQYLYFLTHVLRLLEEESIHPDAIIHGNFLHRVFETFLKKPGSAIESVLEQTLSEAPFAEAYAFDAESQFSEQVLRDIARTTASLLEQDETVQVLGQELEFGSDQSQSPLILDLPGDKRLLIKGKIDRLDQNRINQAYGLVDYKSSDKSFNLGQLYNKLTPQLLTYILALQTPGALHKREGKDLTALHLTEPQVYRAAYLHAHQPEVSLNKAKNTDDLVSLATKDLTYKGLEVGDKGYSQEDLALMLAYTEKLYRDAAETILSGSFAINPYSKNGRAVEGDQLKAITGFEADLHLSQARHLTQFPRAKTKEVILETMRRELETNPGKEN